MFKKGDLILCIDDTNHGIVVKGSVYTVHEDSTGFGVEIKEHRICCLESRFEKIELTTLEKLIYGVK